MNYSFQHCLTSRIVRLKTILSIRYGKVRNSTTRPGRTTSLISDHSHKVALRRRPFLGRRSPNRFRWPACAELLATIHRPPMPDSRTVRRTLRRCSTFPFATAVRCPPPAGECWRPTLWQTARRTCQLPMRVQRSGDFLGVFHWPVSVTPRPRPSSSPPKRGVAASAPGCPKGCDQLYAAILREISLLCPVEWLGVIG